MKALKGYCCTVVQVDSHSSVARINSIGGANKGKVVADVVVSCLGIVGGKVKCSNDAGEEKGRRWTTARQNPSTINRGGLDRTGPERNQRGEWNERVIENVISVKQRIKQNIQGGSNNQINAKKSSERK